MKRLKNQSGFTLAETLLAVLILLLVSIIVAQGIPVARNVYEKVVLGANAQAMLSTAVNNLRSELETAWSVKAEKDVSGKDTVISYFNASTGAKAIIDLDDAGDHPAIRLQDYVPLVEDLIHDEAPGAQPKAGSQHHLVPDENSRLYATYDTVTLEGVIVKINGLKVCKKADDEPLFELRDGDGKAIAVEIRLLSEDVAETAP